MDVWMRRGETWNTAAVRGTVWRWGCPCQEAKALLPAGCTPWHRLALGASQALPSVAGQCQGQQTPQPGEDQEKRRQGTANTE